MASDAANIVDAAILDRAIDWHLRQAEMDDVDWHAFVEWLEADVAHARAFDAVALDMALLSDNAAIFPADAAPVRQPVARTPAPARRTWGWAAGGLAIAAAASLTLMVAPIGSGGSKPYTIETKPGERHDIAFADGTRIELNGATRLVLDHANARIATLESGEATFHVHHDDQNPFTVHSGSLVVQDVGTVFNVERDGARLDVQVAEGSVMFQPKDEAVTLRAGAAVTAREDAKTYAVSKVDASKVGGWRTGAVSFTGAPFGQIAPAMQRIDGASVSIDPSLSNQPFTGMVRLTGKAGQDVPHIAALIGARWHQDGERWVISPR